MPPGPLDQLGNGASLAAAAAPTPLNDPAAESGDASMLLPALGDVGNEQRSAAAPGPLDDLGPPQVATSSGELPTPFSDLAQEFGVPEFDEADLGPQASLHPESSEVPGPEGGEPSPEQTSGSKRNRRTK